MANANGASLADLAQRCQAARERAAELLAMNRRLRCERDRPRSALVIGTSRLLRLKQPLGRERLDIHRHRTKMAGWGCPVAETIEQLIASVRALREDYARVLVENRRLLAQRQEIAEQIHRWAHGDSELPPPTIFFYDAAQRAIKPCEANRHLIHSIEQLRIDYDSELQMRKGMLGALRKAADDTQSLLRARYRDKRNPKVTLPAA